MQGRAAAPGDGAGGYALKSGRPRAEYPDVLLPGTAVFKFALAAGIVIEWLFGPAVESIVGFGLAGLRALMASVLAWIVLESVHLLVRAVLLLDDRA